jgi:hypothetical protein
MEFFLKTMSLKRPIALKHSDECDILLGCDFITAQDGKTSQVTRSPLAWLQSIRNAERHEQCLALGGLTYSCYITNTKDLRALFVRRKESALYQESA